MNKLLTLAVLALLVSGFSGCMKHTITTGNGGTVVKYDKWHHHFVAGLVDASGTVHAEQICPNTKDVTIHEETSFLNGIVQLFTGWIYSPTSVKISCGSST